jgi:iron-sulfur cluster assembly protein
MIIVTESAENKITELMKSEEDDSFVRISVKAGGCSGLSYDLTFDTEMNEGDETYDDSGVTLVTDVRSLLYLMNMTLDYSDGINGKGFQFINPNATRTCGCGESFSI